MQVLKTVWELYNIADLIRLNLHQSGLLCIHFILSPKDWYQSNMVPKSFNSFSLYTSRIL